MTRPFSPARAHFERVSARLRQEAETPAVRRDATAYELMLAKLADDKRRLHEIQSIERKAEVKREILPEYKAWVEGVLEGDSGVQDDVLMTVMVWCIDIGALEQALEIAEYAVRHKLAMPDQYNRTTGCLIAEECAEYALRLRDGIKGDLVKLLLSADMITDREDMPDEVRAKLYKAIGYGLAGEAAIEAKQHALDYLKRALQLHDKVGVKKDIEKLERDIKNLAAPPAGGGG